MCSLKKNASKGFKILQFEIKNLATIKIKFIELSENMVSGRTDLITYF